MEVIAIIPARYASTRFPGKPLAEIKGKTMIQRVYEQCKKSQIIKKVIVATDDERIKEEVEKFGGIAIMTSKTHKTGSERIGEIALKTDSDIIVNVQGDEPLIDAAVIDQTIAPLLQESSIVISTPIKKITNKEDITNSNIVKVIKDKNNFAIYFSRSKIPFDRNEFSDYYKHIGIYVFKKDFLLKFLSFPQTPLEKAESLEQLRILENGYKIRVVETEYESISVDAPEDIKKIEGKIREQNG